MCGRFVQAAAPNTYVKPLSLQGELFGEVSDTQIERYNVAPSTGVWVLTSEDGGARSQTLRWGWESHWAKGGKPPAINARAETLWTSKFWAAARQYRLIVPADGWYEWVTAEAKQPYYIRRRSGDPLFFAAIGQSPPAARVARETDGFVIITADAERGMIALHNRCLVMLRPELALEWINPGTTAYRTERISLRQGTSPKDFEWFPVDRSGGNVRKIGPDLIRPLQL